MNAVAFILGFAAVLVGLWLVFVGPYSQPSATRQFVGWFVCGQAVAVVVVAVFAVVGAVAWPRD